MKQPYILFFLLLCAFQPGMAQQQITVMGRVTGTNGNPIPNATVGWKGTAVSASTDNAGAYSITLPDNGALVFSFVGYRSQEIAVNGRNRIDVVLLPEDTQLEEVVVVGFGTQTKKELIGSVSSVDGEKLARRSVPQLSQALTGQMPGVTVIQRSGQPGANSSTIQIRGVGSFGAATGVLILVDGIPTSSFNDIAPEDVASISVLKDASSAAIYGARAANGVILVTTKTGAGGDKMAISYNGNWGLQTPTAYPDFVDAWEFATAVNETATGGGGYTEEEIRKFRDGTDPDNYPNTDFIGEFFRKSAQQTSHNVSLSDRSEKVSYTLSLGYLNQKGILAKNAYDRYTLRLNTISTLRENLKLTARLSGRQATDRQPSVPATLDFADMNTLISQVIRYAAIYPIRMANGDWGAGNNLKGTPISMLASESFYNARSTDLGANLRLDWTVVPDLTLSALGGYTQQSARTKLFRATQRINDNISLFPASLRQTRPYGDYRTFQALAEYRKQFIRHDLKILAGYSFEQGYDEEMNAFRQDFPSNDLTELNIGSPEGQQNSGTASQWGLESLFARLQYHFAGRYLLEGTLRYDGSSRFSASKKYAVFPSVAAGWLLGEEAFLKDNVSWLTELKIKASYGVLGNQNIGNYPYQNVLATGYNYAFGNAIAPGLARLSVVDSDLRWESTRSADVGLESSIFDRKLTFGATYYDRYTYDILVSPGASVSGVLGFEVGRQNSGKLKTHNDWRYGAEMNFSTVRNEVLDLGVGNVEQPNGLVGNGSTLFIGHPMQLYYGYKTDGLFTDHADVDAWADMTAVNPGARPGDVRYLDISGPDGVPDGKVDAVYDRTFLGSRIPTYSYGLNLNGGYKNLDISLLVQGVGGASGLLDNYAGYALYNTGNIQRWQYDGRWTAENPDRHAAYPRMEQLTNAGSPNTLPSDFWIRDASYLRLRNVQIGYALPKSITARWKVDGLRLHANAENPFTWHSYRKGWDPEINSSGSYYPIMRNFSIGFNFNF